MSHLLTFSRGVLGRATVGRAAVCMVCGASRAPDAVDAVRGYTRTRTLATTVASDAVEDHRGLNGATADARISSPPSRRRGRHHKHRLVVVVALERRRETTTARSRTTADAAVREPLDHRFGALFRGRRRPQKRPFRRSRCRRPRRRPPQRATAGGPAAGYDPDCFRIPCDSPTVLRLPERADAIDAVGPTPSTR